MLMIAALAALFAYGRMTPSWGPKPFVVLAIVVAVLGVINYLQGFAMTAVLVGAGVNFVVSLAIFAAGHALGRRLDRDKIA
jgi:uncharacterized membrane protein